VINVIPGRVEFFVDIRHPDDKLKDQSVTMIQEKLQEVAKNTNVACETYIDWAYNMVPFDENIKKIIKSTINKLDYTSMEVYGGPGHDAKYMSTSTPTAMIFVKSIAGISHSENELTEDKDLIKGANVLLNTVLSLARNNESKTII